MSKKPTPTAHASRVLLATLIGVIAIPAATTGLFRSIDDDGVNVVPGYDLRFNAYNDRAEIRSWRRKYWRAVGIYNELNRLGVEDIVAPEINNTDSINYYLNPENFSAVEGMDTIHAAAPEEGGYLQSVSDAQRDYRNLSERYRDLLDGYVTTGICPVKLQQYHLAGFYDLCVALLREHNEAVAPNLLDRSAYLRGFQSLGYAPLRNLRNRLEVLEESLIYEGGTSVRPRTHSGHRPRLDYSSFR